MALLIGSQPVTCNGKEAFVVVANGLSKSANRPIDPGSVKVRIKMENGTMYELKDGDALEICANVAMPKSAKKDKSAAPKTISKQQPLPAT